MDEKTQLQLDQRSEHGVRNITISRLLEAGRRYDLYTYVENENGNLCADRTHCWLKWESKRTDCDKLSEHWMEEAIAFASIAEAEQAKAYLSRKQTV